MKMQKRRHLLLHIFWKHLALVLLPPLKRWPGIFFSIFVLFIPFFILPFAYGKQKYYVILCLFFFFVLPCKQKTSYRKSRNIYSFLVTSDLSIGSTKTKYIKLNTKTQFLKITFDFCIHFKKENFFFFFCFLVPLCQSV